MRRAKTHFEQIPVEVVKKIAEEEFPEKKEIRDNSVILEIPAKKAETYAVGIRLRCREGII
jgi:hypothetical protein